MDYNLSTCIHTSLSVYTCTLVYQICKFIFYTNTEASLYGIYYCNTNYSDYCLSASCAYKYYFVYLAESSVFTSVACLLCRASAEHQISVGDDDMQWMCVWLESPQELTAVHRCGSAPSAPITHHKLLEQLVKEPSIL